ncbi:YkvA family protein [Terrihabitans sp. B22-R8]|uniref:YkvA family protein n=1 Tax=Terrihabitans sp. B22-R8 TaxID=3425128 RepID=UPI00403D08F5
MTDAADLDLELTEKERIVRKGFWPKLRRMAARLPFAEDAVSAYYCAFDRETPTRVRLILLGALVYFIVPFDAVADFLPLFGLADDAGVLSAALLAVGAHISDSHRAAAKSALENMRNGLQA